MNTNLSDCWLGYLTYATIEKCVSLSKEYCPGCIQGLISSLLHDHQQASLLNKIETYLNESRGLLSSKLDELFTDFLKHMKRSTIEEEKQTLITNGRNFLFIVTPLSLYYGRFLTEEKYSALFTESYNPKNHHIHLREKDQHHLIKNPIITYIRRKKYLPIHHRHHINQIEIQNNLISSLSTIANDEVIFR